MFTLIEANMSKGFCIFKGLCLQSDGAFYHFTSCHTTHSNLICFTFKFWSHLSSLSVSDTKKYVCIGNADFTNFSFAVKNVILHVI